MQTHEEHFSFGVFVVDGRSRTLHNSKGQVAIGARAFDLLLTLLRRAGEVVGKKELLAAVWGTTVVDDGSIRMQMTLLRKALEDDGGRQFIINVPQRGYCFVHPVSRGVPSMEKPVAGRTAPALPARMTTLVGRDSTVASIMTATREHRLITLVGPGGIGKTSIAIAAADQLAAGGAQDVRFVDLSVTTESGLVASTVASSLGIPVVSGGSIGTAEPWIAQQRMVLVIDNCEHLIEAVATVIENLRHHARGIRIIATSREPLRLADEWILRVQPLVVPEADYQGTLEQAKEFPAVALFMERAAESGSLAGFRDDDVPYLVEICRQLDGIPLAIELAAARVEAFGPRGLLQLMKDRLALLTVSRRAPLPRQRTLEATLDWSYGLLDAAEQVMLRRLSLFRDRFSVESAIAVAGKADPQDLATFTRLVAKSLVTVDPSETHAPYRLLGMTRSYAQSHMQVQEEFEQLRQRYAAHVLALLGNSPGSPNEFFRPCWLDQNAYRIGDVREAMDIALDGEDAFPLAAALAVASAALWLRLSLLREYLAYLDRILHLQGALEADNRLLAQLLACRAHVSTMMHGLQPETQTHLDLAVAAGELLDEEADRLPARWIAFTSRALAGDCGGAIAQEEAFTARMRSDFAGARNVYQRMLGVSLHLKGRPVDAAHELESALDLPVLSSTQTWWGNAFQMEHRAASLAMLARVRWICGFPDEALELSMEAAGAADASAHAPTLMFTLVYGACPVASWYGAEDALTRYLAVLRETAGRLGSAYWKAWACCFETGARHAGSGILPIEGATEGHYDLLATVGPHLRSRTIERATNGDVPWCSAEVLRRSAREHLDAGRSDAAQQMLLRAERIALAQGATGWQLRVAIDLALLLEARGENSDARSRLEQSVKKFTQGFASADLVKACALLERL